MIIYKNNKNPWKHIFISKYRYEKSFFFNVKRLPNNHWMTRPRFHAMINLFLVSFWRDNANLRVGIGIGKKQWCLNMHNIKMLNIEELHNEI